MPTHVLETVTPRKEYLWIMQVDLNRRVALVTGAGSGIGEAIALTFAANGAAVAVNDIIPSGEKTVEAIRKQGGKAAFFLADVADVSAVQDMVAAVERELGPIDIHVNNAGVNLGRERYPVHEFPDSDWHRIIRVDLDGVFYCSRAVAAYMVKRKKGAIINIGSVLGVVPIRLQSAFAAAKAGVLHFTRSQALELGPYQIRVNGIAPGSILTPGTQSLFYNPDSKKLADSLLSHIPLGRPGEPQDVANAALFLASDDAKYVTGHVMVVDGGWTAGFAREW
jgi:NAD(P)-dependent dehydrogenase (short-subunit alcohol dehydrogenase family)